MATKYESVNFKKHKMRETRDGESDMEAGPSSSNLPGPGDPADPTAGARTKVMTLARIKERRLLVSLCVFLLSLAIINRVLYLLEMIAHKESVHSFTEQLNQYNLTSRKCSLNENNLQEKKSHIEQLQAEKRNLIRELQTLKGEGVQCDKGWKFFSGKCYFFSTDKKYWTASRDACVAMGGDLVIINSPEEKEFLAKSKLGSLEKYWIGLTDAVTEEDWRWVDGTKLSDEPKYWIGNEPDNWTENVQKHPEGEDCGVMEISSGGDGFLDAVCNRGDKRKRICEVNAAA